MNDWLIKGMTITTTAHHARRGSAASTTLDGPSLVDRMLDEQRRLTAVDRFAHQHGAAERPAQARYYRDLIPLESPGEGQQYAFEVDLDACTGCKACVSACHNLNGLDAEETWRDVGQLIATLDEFDASPADGHTPIAACGGAVPGEEPAAEGVGILQHVTTACHHCVEPACLEGCPVNAYEKDAVTGIVRHLDDQCIGCQYCVFKCPYEVPRYNAEKGIVRKCDMCADRLAAEEAPACAAACPTQAISIRVIDIDEAVTAAEAGRFLPAGPDPSHTQPTTRYRTRRDLSGARAADTHRLEPEHAHMPLVIMLVLTQLSAGGFALGILSERAGAGWFEQVRPLHATMSLLLGMAALGASTLHLGRPLYAFRAVIGLRTSWLSREIVAFGVFAKLAMAYAGLAWFVPDWLEGGIGGGLPIAVALVGLVGVFCSVMIYADTPRPFWRFRDTFGKFALSTVMLGAAVTLLAAGVGGALIGGVNFTALMSGWGTAMCLLLAGATVLKLIGEATALLALGDPAGPHSARCRSARLLVSSLGHLAVARVLVGVLGGIALPLLLIHATAADAGEASAATYLTLLLVIFMLTLVGELLERYLFFTAVANTRMPGGLHT